MGPMSVSSSDFFSMHDVAKPFNLCWIILDLKYFFNNFNFEKIISTELYIMYVKVQIR
jgi:hypothetical protein